MPALYVDRELYRSKTGDRSGGADEVLDALIDTACRAIDRETGVAPGMWGPLASTAFRFNANGGTRLWLRDTADNQYFLRTITSNSLAIDSDADGSYDDYLWDLSDAWVRGAPENAVTFGEAFTSIELLPHLSTAPLSTWPVAVDCIRITGTWGYAVTPGAIVELVCDMVHNLRQGVLAGGGGPIDSELLLSPSMWPVLQRLKAQYSHRLPI